jgi:hypothetical protein
MAGLSPLVTLPPSVNVDVVLFVFATGDQVAQLWQIRPWLSRSFHRVDYRPFRPE